VGAVGVHVTVLDRDSRPMAVPEVRVTLSLPAKDLGPLPVPVEAAGTGHFIGTATLPMAGKWEAVVTIRVSEMDQTTVRLPLDFV
jgi:copper transport protein